MNIIKGVLISPWVPALALAILAGVAGKSSSGATRTPVTFTPAASAREETAEPAPKTSDQAAGFMSAPASAHAPAPSTEAPSRLLPAPPSAASTPAPPAAAGWEIVIDPKVTPNHPLLQFLPPVSGAPASPELLARAELVEPAAQPTAMHLPPTSHAAATRRETAAPPAPAPPRAAEPPSIPQDRYRIREGDLLDVFVWGQDNLSGRFRVGRDGTVTIRLAGTVQVRHLTADEAAALVAARLDPYLVAPAVTVSVSEASGRDVLLVGEVEAPGIYPIERPTSLLELLLRAKYKSDAADLSAVTLVREGATTRADIAAVLRGERFEGNVTLQSGDMVVVPGRDLVLSVHGEAVRPGRYRFERDRPVRVKDLLIEGSMWTARANLDQAYILRGDGALDPVNLNALWFRGDAAQDKTLRHGDALVLPTLPAVGVYVLGKVESPGLHQLQAQGSNASPNVLQALALAKPDNFGARLYDARLVRGWPSDPRVYPLNLQAVLEGDLSQNIALQNGDVIYIPQTAVSYSLEFWNNLLVPITGTASTISTVQSTVEFVGNPDGSTSSSR